MNAIETLSRSEMRAIKGGATCEALHSCNGCFINFVQLESSWTYQVDCGEGAETWHGSGQYGGTFCGGTPPCGLGVA